MGLCNTRLDKLLRCFLSLRLCCKLCSAYHTDVLVAVAYAKQSMLLLHALRRHMPMMTHYIGQLPHLTLNSISLIWQA